MQECARPTELSEVVEQMQLEHEELSVLLSILKQMVIEIGEEEQISGQMIASLKQSASRFMNRYEEHLEWGRNELLPLVGIYEGKGFAAIVPSMNELGYQYDRAVCAMNSLLDMPDSSIVPSGVVATTEWDALFVNLQLALDTFADYLAMEKEHIFPLADQLLTDIDYLFS
jgi:hypothetical protein